MLVTELKEKASLPYRFLDELPDSCPTCGFPTEITETLTILSCSNPRCMDKLVQRVVALAKRLGIKGLGESKALGFLSKFGLDNPLAIFAYEPSDGTFTDSCSMEVSTDLYNQIQASNKFLLWEFVRAANLPKVQDVAQSVFSGYSSLSQAYSDIENGGVAFIREKIQGKSKEGVESGEVVSVRAAQIYTSLMQFKDDLFSIVEYVKIINTDTIPTLKVAISTAVGAPFTSKDAFIKYVNEEYDGRVYVEFMSSVTRGLDYLIWSKVGGKTSKVLKAENYGVPVVTGSEFVALLNSKY